MKVKDLKAILDELPEEDLELELTVYADHGQDVSKAYQANVVKATKDGGRYFEVHPDDMEEYDQEDLDSIFLIDGE